jgi:hypothetical protein
MPETTEILRIVRPRFTVRVYENVLRIDLKGSVKNDIEEAFENTPVLEQTIGSILGMFIPLHVHLSGIDSVHMDKRGKVVIKLPRHRDVVIPLEPRDAKRLVDKLNQLVPAAKEKELRRIMKEHKLQRIEKVERELAKEKLSLSGGGAQFPIPSHAACLRKRKEGQKSEKNERGRTKKTERKEIENAPARSGKPQLAIGSEWRTRLRASTSVG